ncbi:hypothetical protein [Caballeronia sp. LZ019]|uniref:hypothetical protein n=1 Tax=Caballeronia sp. LZ019 TaxID=3038555 RepID=UPI00285C3D61|nr:hypothetical protein [Caballeronia sp. LZ019]MDR5806744.1 hypothetical protein [Caballeronia sp. LZ019]
MNNWQPTNPVDRRLMDAHQDWLQFAQDKPARLLYWSANEPDLELIHAYFQSQKRLSSAVMQFTSPFETESQYPLSLVREISDYYEKTRDGSAANGIVANWSIPSRSNESETHHLMNVLDSLMAHHPDVFPGMVLVLRPQSIKNEQAFERWLDELLGAFDKGRWRSERLRLVQYGVATAPLASLRQNRPSQVKLVRGRYYMEAVPRELVAQSGERGPGGEFRRLFVELSESISRDDPQHLARLRERALAITSREQWPDQSAVVHLIAGAAYLKWKSNDEALAAYQAATQAGRQALDAAHPGGNKLVVNGLFGEASVHLMQSDFKSAARCYDEAAQYAAAEQDGILTVESRRMQAWCLEKTGRTDQAFEAGMQALAAGQWLEPAIRSNSNLQLVTAWMLGQTGFFDKHHKRRDDVVPQFKSLYGENWREGIKPLAPDQVSRLFIAAQEGA